MSNEIKMDLKSEDIQNLKVETKNLPIDSDENPNTDKLNEINTPGFGIRHVQSVLLFFLMLIGYALRVNMSVAIVAITDKKTPNPNAEHYDWNSSTQSIILSSFFWGYVINQLPSGPLARRFGSKILLLISFTICSLLNLLTPLAASWGDWGLVVAFRVLQGLTQSFVFPCSHALLAKWAPISERGRLTTFVYAGSQLGTVLMLAISGILASSPIGWPSIFYVSGAAGCIWSIAWFFWGANSPAEYKRISENERQFIENSSGSDSEATKPTSIPWREIFTSIPFLSLLIVHMCQNWGFWTLLTNIPTFMAKALDYDIKSNALLSALPYFVTWILSFFFSWLADYMYNKKIITMSTSRKLFNSIGHWIPMVVLIALGYVTKDNKEIAIVLLTLAVSLNAGTYVGYILNHMDLSPNFAGTLMGITNFFANCVSIVAPLLVGIVVDDEGSDMGQWRIIFFTTSAIYLVGNLLFVIFGSAEVQPWNNLDTETKSNTSDINYSKSTVSH